MNRVVLKVKHSIDRHPVYNFGIAPLVKTLLGWSECDFRQVCPALDPHAKKVVLDELVLTANRKIMVAGLPKSGNTWVQAFLGEYFDAPLVQPFLDLRRSGIALNHFAPGLETLYRRDIVRCVYVVRDMRDVVCSHYHYARTPFYARYVDVNYDTGRDLTSFYFDYFLRVIVPHYRWTVNGAIYASHGVPVVRFEDLCADAGKAFSDLLRRAQIPVDSTRVTDAVRRSSFDRLCREGLDTAKGGRSHFAPKPPSHFRRGRAGSWRKELPGKVLDDITTRFGEYLTAWGYDGSRNDRSAPESQAP
jgi:hypothetical protein